MSGVPVSPQASPHGSPAGSPTSQANAEERLLRMLDMMQQNQQMLTQMMQQQQQQAQAARSSSSGSAHVGLGAKDLSKVLKHPPVFSCKNRDEELVRWPSWSWEFEQYLITLDKEFQNEFQYIKKNPKAPLPVTAQTAEEADRSRIVYGLLASLLNDRLKRVLKTIPNANGFEAYRQISADLKPSSRTRALALISMIHSWPVFESTFPKKVQQIEAEASTSQPTATEGNGGNGKPKATPKPQVRRLMLNLDDFSESNEGQVCVVQMDRLDCKHFSPCVCFSACSSIGQCAQAQGCAPRGQEVVRALGIAHAPHLEHARFPQVKAAASCVECGVILVG